jgi:hypothetical protein
LITILLIFSTRRQSTIIKHLQRHLICCRRSSYHREAEA